MSVLVAYLVNQYPKVSHSFIRREILALEAQGIQVERIALRGWDADVVDTQDHQEREKTRYLLQGSKIGLLLDTIKVALVHPKHFFSALRLAIKMGFRADRPLPLHLIYLAEACRAFLWLKNSGAQHFHAHFGTNSTEVVMLTHALGGPNYSFTVHGPEEFDKPEFLGLPEKIRRSAFVVAISSFGRSQLFRLVDFAQWSKIQVVHCGLEKSFHAITPRPIPSEPRLVCVGRLCEQKGQLLLVEAAYQLAKKGIAFQLVLAGDGEMRAEIEALISRYQLTSNIRITGWISSDQVREEILASRALVLPSFAEGLPVVIMEAMALHRPVLSTYVAGIPELVIPGENGLLFPAGSVDALAETMEHFLAYSDDVLQNMGVAAYQRVIQRHDIDTEAARLAELFRKYSSQ